MYGFGSYTRVRAVVFSSNIYCMFVVVVISIHGKNIAMHALFILDLLSPCRAQATHPRLVLLTVRYNILSPTGTKYLLLLVVVSVTSFSFQVLLFCGLLVESFL